ncbi:hypothetical protein [Leucobacter sp. USHLN153]|uniref:hypothetical protein n=1 Tax=Leucobacter sp. USHLN153 TaxID=3081268 RepID=UPI0030196252
MDGGLVGGELMGSGLMGAQAGKATSGNLASEPFDVLLIDGRSGSGKTQAARSVAKQWSRSGVEAQLFAVESLYPGWDGLAEGSAALAAVLRGGSYRPYNWIAGQFGDRVSLERGVPLIIEGCGALTRENLAAAEEWAERALGGARRAVVRSIWLDCPADLRRERALARDGDTYAPHWERWAAQEDALYSRHRPWELADQVERESTHRGTETNSHP